MRKAIVTKYLPATNYMSSRVSAGAMDNRPTTFPYPHELSVEQAHAWAAMQFAKKMNWPGLYVAGALGRGNVFVCIAGDDRDGLGSAISETARLSGNPYGIEGEDWFFLAEVQHSEETTEWKTEHANSV